MEGSIALAMGHILLISSQIKAWGNVYSMFIRKWDLYLQSKVGELCCDRITISTSLNPLMKRGPLRTDCERVCTQMLKHKKHWRIPWFCCTFAGVTTNLSSYCSFQKSGIRKGYCTHIGTNRLRCGGPYSNADEGNPGEPWNHEKSETRYLQK